MPAGVEEGIGRGIYLFQQAEPATLQVQLMGSGAILREVIAAADLLRVDFAVAAPVWSIPGINQLHRDGMLTEEWNRYHPEQDPRQAYLTEVLAGHDGPVIISTDYVRAYPEQLRRFIPQPLTVLGTDGFGRSDTREVLRDFFKVDRYHIVIAALAALADQDLLPRSTVSAALTKYAINPDRPHSLTC